MIPRRFFWVLDLIALGCAFLLAYQFVPFLQSILLGGGTLYMPWTDSLFLPAPLGGQLPALSETLWLLLAMALATLPFMELLSVNKSLLDQSRARIFISSLIAPLVGLSLITLIMYAFKSPSWSRLFVFSFTALSGISLATYRMVLRAYFLRRKKLGYYTNNVVLIGLKSDIDWVAHHFTESIPPDEHRLVGYLTIHPEQPPFKPRSEENAREKGTEEPLECLGSAQELGDLLINQPIHNVIVIQPATGGEYLQQVIQDCEDFRLTLRIVPSALLVEELANYPRLYRHDRLKLPAVLVKVTQLNTEALFFKRVIDILVSAALLVLLLPVFGLIALAIKITTPHLQVFFPWKVVGKNGMEFTGFKFTTMVADADDRKSELMPYNVMKGPVFKMEEDPRVTPLGRFLRKFSLNELPQLWSVLIGDMSLVGPRPAFRQELDRYEFWHKRKLSIQPGITCLWQVRGRHKIRDFDDWARMDLEYIDNWSLWLDFKIVLRTIWVVLGGSGV